MDALVCLDGLAITQVGFLMGLAWGIYGRGKSECIYYLYIYIYSLDIYVGLILGS